MKTIGYIILILIAVPLLYLGSGGVYQEWHTYTHRYQIKIEVETPEGVRSGASVIEVSIAEKAYWLLGGGGIMTREKGEAVFIDLGGGKNVIAVLGFGPIGEDDKIYYLASEAMNRKGNEWYRNAGSWQGSTELTGRLIPTLVTFSDLANPSTLQIVRPDEFEKVFGPGYRFRGAWLEMTHDTVTRGIQKILPWLGNHDAEVVAERRIRTYGRASGSIATGRKFSRGR
jgi:hypothetical protein